MTDIQKTASAWNDGTIIAFSPIVTGAMMEPSRIVLRDLGNTYVVHLQYWPISQVRDREVIPSYTSGNYYPKSELGALSRAWARLTDRFDLLRGHDPASRPEVKQSAKAKLRTEISTLSQS